MAYRTLEERFKRLSDIGGALAVLEWDHQVMMPRGGNETRAEQVATLRQMAHEILTDARTAELLGEAEARAARCLAACQSARDAARPCACGSARSGAGRSARAGHRARRDGLARCPRQRRLRGAGAGADRGRAADPRGGRRQGQGAGPRSLRCVAGWLRAGPARGADRRPARTAGGLPAGFSRAGAGAPEDAVAARGAVRAGAADDARPQR